MSPASRRPSSSDAVAVADAPLPPPSVPLPPTESASDTRTVSPSGEGITPRRGVSLRAVLIGLLFAGLFAGFTPYNDYKVAATYIAGTQFPIGALFVELVLVGVVNVLFRKFSPRYAFSQGELLTVWTLILVGSGLPSSGMMRYFIPMIAGPQYLSTATNNWEGKVWGALPSWLKIQDADAAMAYGRGYPRGQEHIPWGAWVQPLFFWCVLAVLFLIASFCMASLLRRQWVENEKFTFPLVQLPVLLAEEPKEGRLVSDLLRSPFLWLSVLLVTILHTVRGMHLLYPSIPNIETHWSISDNFTQPPLNKISPIDIFIYPLVIGICYLLPAEVCFSLWFFHLFYKAEMYVGAVYNWDMPGPVGGYTYRQFHGLEAFGGAVALLAWTLWTGRRHFADVWEKATNGPRARDIDDSREMLSYRATLFGLAFAYAGIGLWLAATGVSTLLILLTLLMLTLALVVISWVVCQAGLLFMAQPYGSIDILASTFGTAPFKVTPLYTICRWEGMFIYDTREMLAPSVLMGAKSADITGINPRKLLGAMGLAVAVSFAVSLYFSLALPYYNGGGLSLQNPFMYNTAPSRPLSFLGGAASVPYKGWMGNWLHVFGGFLGVLALLIARAQFNVGLHPIGFLCASVYSLHAMWSSIFIGWALKSIVQRYGGMKLYLGALPFFLGLILGDVLNAAVWVVLGNLTQVGYQVTPN